MVWIHLAQAGANRRVAFKTIVNYWVASTAEDLLKGITAIGFQKSIHITCESTKTWCTWLPSTALHSPEALWLSLKAASKLLHFSSNY